MKAKSAVWKFFERVTENNRCVAVVCKLCENHYKFFGNTTNLRVHLINKHPIQWELSESGNLEESFREEDVSPEASKDEPRSTRRKKYASRHAADSNVGYSVSIDNIEGDADGTIPKIEIQRVDPNNSDSEQDDDATTMYMVRQMHGEENSGEAEEWLEEDPFQITHIETYEPKPKRKRVRYRKIKQEIESPTDLPGYYVAPKPEKRIYEETVSRKDEYSVFGEYVANKLRKIKMPRTRGNLQQLITTLLWQADYGMFDTADAVKRVLMISVQPDADIDTALNMTPTEIDQKEDTHIVIEQCNNELSQSNEDLNAANTA